MITLSVEIEQTIERHMASGGYESVEELLHQALALLPVQELDDEKLRAHLLAAKQGERLEATVDFYREAREEASRHVAARQAMG